MSKFAPKICVWCEEPVLADEQHPMYGQPMHQECGVRSVAGSVGHIHGECSCFGGTEEDPKGMTRREAAKAALEAFMVRNSGG